MRPLILPLAAVFFLASTALGQAPQLLVKNPDNPAEKPHPIALSKADVQLMMAGSLCQTTMTLTFSNDANRVLEGELVFPLPENATICAYALDVGGQMVESVTVSKEKARRVFETEVRKGIDPGMIEQVQGNNFRTRIFPIPANGSRTIRVQYVSQPVFKGEEIVYSLPVQWPGSLPDLTIGIESFSTAAPKVENVPGLEFKGEGNKFVANKRFEKATFAGNVALTLPAASAVKAIVEKRTYSTVSVENLDPKTADQFVKTDHYFVINDMTAPTPVKTAVMQAKPLRIGIMWDASLSRGGVDHATEFDLIKAQLKALGNVKVAVTPFRNVPEKETTFNVDNGDATEVINFLSNLAYDGGTNLGALWLGKLTASEKDKAWKDLPPLVGYYLLFTDGLSNLGADLPAKAEVPVYTISNDPKSNYNVLRRIAGDSGGQYINLQSQSTEQAMGAMTENPFSLISIECDAKEIADVYPRLPIATTGRVTLAGRLLAKSAKLTLNYGRGGEITQRVPVTVSQEGATEENLVSRYWAQLKLADLSINSDSNEKEITALGLRFNLVTPYTSMIVLETVEQYLQHKIIPPKSRAEIYSEFMKRIEANQQVSQKEEKAKIDRVVGMWNARVAWWNQDFKYAADFKYKEAAGKKDEALATDALRLEAESVHAGGGNAPPRPGQAAADPRPAAPPPEARVESLERARRNAEERLPESSVARGDTPTAGSGGARGIRAGFQDRLSSDRPLSDESGVTRTIQREQEQRQFPLLGSRTGETSPHETDALIAIKAWSPDTPYLKALQAAPADQAYSVYLKDRKTYETSPAFYLDCADFFAKSQPELALRILTDIPELALEDGRLLRIAAHRLGQLGQVDLAIDLFEKVAKLRPEEPQSFRDLALALADRAEQKMAVLDVRDFPIEASRPAMADYQRSLELLHKVVMNQWDRFDEIEAIALMEANRIIARINTFPEAARPTNPFDTRLVKLLDPDLRIVMTWDTDNTDIDLHVTEPTGETCVYNHNRTTIGGALSKDFTQGYGPEEYLLKKLMPGEYKIQAHFYGSRDQKLIGPTTVQATVITHFGRADEKRQAITLRLKDAKEMVDIGTVTLKP